MKLQKLKLLSFGRFNNFELPFADGFNLIYGENEAGKSTILKFIKGMLYGFKVYGHRRSIKDEDYNRFYPWGRAEYRGVLFYTVGDRHYRVDRDFARDVVKVYDDVTGRDITGHYPQDRRREVLFAREQFGLNERVFMNTVCIPQLGCRSDDDLAGELQDRLAALASAGSDQAATRAVQMLEKAAKELGTDTPSGKPIGLVLAVKAELDDEKRHVEQVLIQLRQNQLELTRREEERRKITIRIRELKAKLTGARAALLKKRWNDVEKVLGEQAEIKKRIQELAPYRNFPADGAETVKQLKLRLEDRRSAVEAARNDEKQKSEAVEEESRKLHEEFPGFENCDHIEIQLDEKNSKLGKINIETLYSRADGLNDRLKSLMQTVRAQTVVSILTGLVGLLALMVGSGSMPLLLLAALSAAVMAGVLSTRRKSKKEFLKTREDLTRISGEIREAVTLRDQIEAEIRDLLHSVNCADAAEFKTKAAAYRRRSGELIAASAALDEVRRGINRLQEEINGLEAEIARQLKNAGCKDIGEYFRGCDNHAELKRLSSSLEELEKRLAALLSGMTPDGMKMELEALMAATGGTAATPPAGPDVVEALENEIRLLEQKLSTLDSAITAAKTVEREKLNGLRDLAEIEEDIARADERYVKLRTRREALQLAAENIKAISEELHREFAPALNRHLGRIVSSITGRYADVKVDETLKISTGIPGTDEIKPVDALSCGTVDQFYFALRAALADVVAPDGVRLPLILDDAFVNYDDVRLKRALEFLTRLARERQVLLFTCHRRELELLEKIGGKINVIELGGIS